MFQMKRRRRSPVPIEQRQHFHISAELSKELYMKLNIQAAAVQTSCSRLCALLLQMAWDDEQLRQQAIEVFLTFAQQQQPPSLEQLPVWSERDKATGRFVPKPSVVEQNGHPSTEDRLATLEEKLDALLKMWQ